MFITATDNKLEHTHTHTLSNDKILLQNYTFNVIEVKEVYRYYYIVNGHAQDMMRAW